MQVGTEIMKLKKHVFAISLGAAMLAAMVIVVSMMGASKAPTEANSGDKAASIILASAHLPGSPRTNMATAEAARPSSIPVPCPIWFLGQLVGYGKTADGAAAGPRLVPGGIWFMQKFADVARKTL